jgi:hypothetical protein
MVSLYKAGGQRLLPVEAFTGIQVWSRAFFCFIAVNESRSIEAMIALRKPTTCTETDYLLAAIDVAPKDIALPARSSVLNSLGSSAMAAVSSNGEANELIDEVARSEVNEMGDAMATASGGGEASEPKEKKKKKSKWTVKQKSGDQKKVERRARGDGDGG